MCGRFAFYSPAEAAAALFGVETALAVEPRYNIAPTQYVAVIRESGVDTDQGRELAMLRWGLIPSWAKDASIGNRMINARAETVAEKPSFRAAFKRRRCLVLADGFYEWHRAGDTKIPHFISQADGVPFAFAALWETWDDKKNGDSIQSTTLLTTAANDFMMALHHRMPIVLNPDTANLWMAGDNELIESWQGPTLRAWPVDRRVNNARNEGDDLISPVGKTLAP